MSTAIVFSIVPFQMFFGLTFFPEVFGAHVGNHCLGLHQTDPNPSPGLYRTTDYFICTSSCALQWFHRSDDEKGTPRVM